MYEVMIVEDDPMVAMINKQYVTENKQMGEDVRITIYEKAKINPAGIPALMQQYRRGLQFKTELEPKFILTPKGNVVEALTTFVQELAKLVEQ